MQSTIPIASPRSQSISEIETTISGSLAEFSDLINQVKEPDNERSGSHGSGSNDPHPKGSNPLGGDRFKDIKKTLANLFSRFRSVGGNRDNCLGMIREHEKRVFPSRIKLFGDWVLRIWDIQSTDGQIHTPRTDGAEDLISVLRRS